MNKKTLIGIVLVLLNINACTINSNLVKHAVPKVERTSDFNFDWKFTLVNDTNLPAALPTKTPLNDTDWRSVRLPHDWSVEHSFSQSLEGATGYLPGGVGIYQKHFKTPAEPSVKSTFILFDGVYNNATLWLNGQPIGENPYGYSPFYFDLTEFLKTDGTDNVLTVHVDHSRYVDSRWYTGSGIYRNVKLVTVDKLHIPIWGTFVTTPEISEKEATVRIDIDVLNQAVDAREFQLSTQIIDATGNPVSHTQQSLSMPALGDATFSQELKVTHPKLWDIETPHLYKAVTTISYNDQIVDSYTSTFGIRSIKFINNKGFELNGKLTQIKGVSIHHDGGLVGAAVPKGVWKRRLQKLKNAGVNGIRTAHNPYSQEFLDLCDEMGFLVQNEFFDEFDYPKDKRLNKHERHDDYISRGYTEHFQKWAKSDLTRTMLRDRNHPSVVQWSIGNEIEWTYLNYREVTGFWDPEADDISGNFWGGAPKFSVEELRERYKQTPKREHILADTAKKLSDWTRALDTTRPITTNMIIPQVSLVSGYADTVDIAGFSYRNVTIPWALNNFPDKHITINENPGTWDDLLYVYQYPEVFSQFMWTGIDYMGERHQKWPHKSGWGDILDLAGFELQGHNYFKSVWVNEPHLSLGTLPLSQSGFSLDKKTGFAKADNNRSYWWRDSNRHWNYKKGEPVLVEVASNHAMVELFLNGRSLGYRSMTESADRLLRWVVPFEEGELIARAGFKGQEQEAKIVTVDQATNLNLTTDKTELLADGYDVAHLVVQLQDGLNRDVTTENVKVTFDIEGEARLLGVDNGATDNIQDFQSTSLVTHKGRALAIIQSIKGASGKIKVTAKANGIKAGEIIVKLK
ncbi:glycoside hydrolase family 2 TIM barrel-domain containing protein [Paraglaciecola arctica]|uniref:glycoside hydrolase family 2 TIM barrel-domain containing protein n=1 Tax=Paraglaciecola arctica TaxID=1128911 RepID=UPI001C07D5AA|nr:glycoside hydrolase family 2 TIM barrel-domain containing protein [Paraglaciecola arctica]MBU3005357.1 DUF4982 domain-containing protein [Paraglaciecola arctica]